jgi:predicted ATP-grasp superfamily ATP-dependent carboligase
VANGQDCAVIGVTEQLIGKRQFGSKGFRYCGNILPLPEILLPEEGRAILERVYRLAVFLTREYGLIGVNGIDFILKGDQVCIIEVNPRYSASMELIERAHGVTVFQAHAKAVLDGKLPQFSLATGIKQRNFFGKAILFAEEPAIVPNTRSWLERSIRDVPTEGEQLLAGNPVCTIFANQPTYEETLDDMARQAASLRKEIHG